MDIAMQRIDYDMQYHPRNLRHSSGLPRLLSQLSRQFLCPFLCTVLLLLSSVANAATLVSTVDKATIPANETFTLHVTYDADPGDEEIDTTLLQQQFKIAARNKTSSLRIINGQASQTTTWYFELAPRQTGTVLIPSFSINNTFSEAIQITVTNAPKTAANTNKQIYSEVEIDKSQVHVQEQLIVSWRLVSLLPISNPSMEMPAIDNVLVHDLGHRQYQRSSADGKIEVVLEQRYAFFPQKSETLVIPAQQFYFVVNTQRRFSGGLLHNSPEKRRINTDSQSITVLPAATNDNRQWLPAIRMDLAQSIQGMNPDGSVTAGEAFTRVVTLRTLGLMAEQLPATSLDVPDFKVYNDKPELRNENHANGVTGIRTERVTMIPAKDGTLTLPTLEIPWFNVGSKQWETAVLPAKTLVVLPAKNKTATQLAPGQPAAGQDSARQEARASDTPGKPEFTALPVSRWPREWIAGIAFLLVGLVLLVVRMVYLQRKLDSLLATGNLPTTRPAPVTVRESQDALSTAAAQNDIDAFYKAVLQWARQHWKSNPPHNLADVAARVTDSELRNQLNALEACLYGNQQSLPALTGIAAALLQDATNSPAVEKNHMEKQQLEKLYQD